MSVANEKIARVDDTAMAIMADLSRRIPDLSVWKRSIRGFSGEGDIDITLPHEDLPGITTAIMRYTSSRKQYRGSVLVVCHHGHNRSPHLILNGSWWPRRIELDACWQPSRFGARVASPRSVAHLSELDGVGIRRVSDAARAVIDLIHALPNPARPDFGPLMSLVEDVRFRCPIARRSEWDEAVGLLVPPLARDPFARIADCVGQTSALHRQSRLASIRLATASLESPKFVLARLGARLNHRRRNRCPLLETARNGRTPTVDDFRGYVSACREADEVVVRID